MSIAPVKKVTLAGPLDLKEATLERLQQLGSMHIVPLSERAPEPEKNPSREADEAYKALRFLSVVSGARRQIRRDPNFDVQDFIARTLDLKQRLREVGDRRDFLEDRIATLEPWGELVFPPPGALGKNLLWFYELPIRQRARLDDLDLPWEVIGQDNETLYVAVVSPDEPPSTLLPVERVHIGNKPRSQLIEELEDAEIALEALRADRIALTRYLTLFRAHLSEAESHAELLYAMGQTRDEDRLFVVQGWVPESDLDAVFDHAESAGLAILVEEATWTETPPTKLEQPAERAAGVDLAMFYQVPNYRGWDPAVLLIGSFAVFFAMIVADAGYGLVILAGLLLGWQPLGTSPRLIAWRRMGLILSAATIAYGVIIGSYFGGAPPEETLLGSLVLLSLNDFDAMMRLSILVGAAHIILAIALNARAKWHRRSARAGLGWIAVILGGLALWLNGQTGPAASIGAALVGLGLLIIVGFSSDRPVERPLDRAWRVLDGVMALTGIMGGFGDVLSYMRLFALGLASSSLAVTFNNLATQVYEAAPGIGLLLSLLILLVGHVLNFTLALLSGVVHGLRLNYIEFFKWGLPEEGVAFRPLARREVTE